MIVGNCPRGVHSMMEKERVEGKMMRFWIAVAGLGV